MKKDLSLNQHAVSRKGKKMLSGEELRRIKYLAKSLWSHFVSCFPWGLSYNGIPYLAPCFQTVTWHMYSLFGGCHCLIFFAYLILPHHLDFCLTCHYLRNNPCLIFLPSCYPAVLHFSYSHKYIISLVWFHCLLLLDFEIVEKDSHPSCLCTSLS